MTEPYDLNTGIHNNVQITIDLNELVATRGEFLFKDDDVKRVFNVDTLSESKFKEQVFKDTQKPFSFYFQESPQIMALSNLFYLRIFF